ncbi:EpsG family protein [Acinetobacter johnsonii]|uniref:EpsG family protein n=1 Tax=Acinetobacter johnsonii TaxID=40214 RepID=UPI001F439D4D|nr:EpsG family protein [Acinetobacter johnsonii]UIP94976.1 EpsG family protein [Acinetobacter johnsonii]
MRSIFFIKKINLLYFFIIILSLYISICVSNKPSNLDKDYFVYFNAFNANESKEITFNIVTQVCKYFGLTFPYLLFFYCFISLIIKYKLFIDVFYRKSILTLVFVIVMYMTCFFPLWEVTQIRMSVAVGIFVYAIFCVKSERNKYLILILSLLFHNSMFVLVGFYLIINFLYKYKWLALVVSLVYIYVCGFVIGLTDYDVYSSSNWGESYNIFSFKNFFIFLTNSILIYLLIKNKSKEIFFKDTYNLVILNFMLLVFCIYIGIYYPSVAIRFSDLLLFNTIFALACFSNVSFLRAYKVITALILIPFYLNIFFFGSDPMFDFDLFLGLFI